MQLQLGPMPLHSSILAWKVPWTEEPGGLQSMGSQSIGHDLRTREITHTFCTAGHLQDPLWGTLELPVVLLSYSGWNRFAHGRDTATG